MKYIEVLNWKQYNPRPDYLKNKYRLHWFRVEYDIFFDIKFQHFSADELLVFFFLLAQMCQNQGKPFLYDEKYISRHSRVKITNVRSAVSKLAEMSMISITVQNCNSTVTELLPTEHNITEQINAEQTLFCSLGEYSHYVKESLRQDWINIYDSEAWVDAELKKAKAWLKANPKRKPKSNFARFFNSWLNRASKSARKKQDDEVTVISAEEF